MKSLNANKKVLIITYYWPPCGGIGVLRCLKIAKYLRRFGWEPIIYTADGATYPSIDQSNFKDIPEGVEIIKGKIWEPYGIYKFITGKPKSANVNNVFYTKEKKEGMAHKLSVWIRSNFFIPDARRMWIKPSVKKLVKFVEENQVDAIFSNGPPHSNTRIATLLKKETNIPWLADFQDPWTQIDYYQLLSLTKRGDAKHRRMEQEAFLNADKITIVSDSWKKDLESIGAKNVEVIPWGFDPDDYKDLRMEEHNKFIVSHLGILGYDRNPEHLFRAVRDLREETELISIDRFQISLAGQVDYSIIELAKDLGVHDLIKFEGNLTRTDALQLMKNSSLLLLLLNQQSNAKGRIPGKLFEYLAVRRPILCLGIADSDAGNITEQTGAGVALAYGEYEKIKAHLLTQLEIFHRNGVGPDLNSEIDIYSIVKQTEKIGMFLDQISNKP